jgi:hypothetical protein
MDKTYNPLSYGAKLYLNGELVSDHSFGDWVQKTAPSCSIAGLEGRKCARCGYHETKVIEALGHDMSAATCTEVSKCKCTGCNHTVGTALGHNFVNYVYNNDATLESDGTYRLAPRSEASFIVKGTVTDIDRKSLITDSDDTYVSREIGLTVNVDYQIIDRKTGAVLRKGTASGTGSYFNKGVNTVSAMDTALSYATRLVAESITLRLTSI